MEPEGVAVSVETPGKKDFAGTKTPQKKKDDPQKKSTPQKKQAAEQVFPMVKEPPGLPKFDERESQNHISAPEEPMEVPLSFKREYDAEELMEYPGTLFNGKVTRVSGSVVHQPPLNNEQ